MNARAPGERVAGLVRDEFAALGVWLPDIRADLRDPQRPLLVIGTVTLGTGFGVLRVLADYQRLLKAERARLGRRG
ncbi:hypothetical protein B7755_019865 [Streptomyces sp. NBS 14/10]|uniref:hypothetical protein n=1 Tax=Streptomyces sp. NBS 14/10 TaxID=1945643 RepID=UPI000B7EAE66|nr:hypothetical protein [Streptomyces sp. NBS 14/10]KAK1180206.1 hypothetical protein B7755_019865 [Streptomyces sp. NBS 14/10]